MKIALASGPALRHPVIMYHRVSFIARPLHYPRGDVGGAPIPVESAAISL